MQSPDISSHRPKLSVTQNSLPQLLVSVRNVAEAKMAVAGGCDVLDIKEPKRGSLGMAEGRVINEIAECGTQSAEQKKESMNQKSFPPVSAALGEVVDWEEGTLTEGLLSRLSYLKLGLSDLGDDQNWLSRWGDVRHGIEEHFTESTTTPSWIAVAYADWEQANSPRPYEILEAAITHHCTGFLIDTFVKDGSTLLDHISVQELIKLSSSAKEHRLLFSVAGSLQATSLPNLGDVRPDIIAIRSAACHNGVRTKGICKDAVQDFRAMLLRTFQAN